METKKFNLVKWMIIAMIVQSIVIISLNVALIKLL